MTDPTAPERHFTEKEVAVILRRATEMQRAEPTAPNPTGLTLAELEEIAGEAGIDVTLLRRAAAELHTTGSTTLGATLAGAPMVITLERIIHGEFPASYLDELVPTIQAGTAGQGHASAVGNTLTWSSRTDTNTTSQQVLVSAKDGQTLIRFEERMSGLAGGLFGGILGGVGVGAGVGLGGAIAGVLGSAVLGVGIPIVVLSGSYYLARTIFTAQVAKRRRAAEVLLDELTATIQRRIEEPGLLPGSSS